MSKKTRPLSLIISLILGALIIGGAVFYVYMQRAPVTDYLLPSGDQIRVPTEMSTCGEGNRCIVVDTMCGFCCDYVAINAAQELSYNLIFDQSCSRYAGPVCSCFDLESYPACIDGTCQLVKWEAE